MAAFKIYLKNERIDLLFGLNLFCEKKIIIDFNERDIAYDYADLNEITLTWATSIHKSQGSEYPVVIFPFYTQHYMMLSRNLFYTGLTRSKKLTSIVGSEAVAIANYLALRDRSETGQAAAEVYQIERKVMKLSKQRQPIY